MLGVGLGRVPRERLAAVEVVRYRTKFGDLVEVADLAIALDSVGAYAAARHFRRTAAMLRDEYIGGRSGHVAYSKRLGDPYCVFDPFDHVGRKWNIPRWVVDEGQVLLLLDDVVSTGLVLGRIRGSHDSRRQARQSARFARALARSEGLVVDLPCLQDNQPLP